MFQFSNKKIICHLIPAALLAISSSVQAASVPVAFSFTITGGSSYILPELGLSVGDTLTGGFNYEDTTSGTVYNHPFIGNTTADYTNPISYVSLNLGSYSISGSTLTGAIDSSQMYFTDGVSVSEELPALGDEDLGSVLDNLTVATSLASPGSSSPSDNQMITGNGIYSVTSILLGFDFNQDAFTITDGTGIPAFDLDTLVTPGFAQITIGGTYSILGEFDYVSPVPLPAAVWLFGSAIFGFAGFSRFKKRAA